MLISADQFINGAMCYVEKDVIPNLSGIGQMFAGFGAMRLQRKASDIIAKLKDNKIVKTLDIIDENGMIEIDTLLEDAISGLTRYSGGQFEYDAGKIIGVLVFKEADFRRLHQYLTEQNTATTTLPQ